MPTKFLSETLKGEERPRHGWENNIKIDLKEKCI
jgi:hypothetical protein